MEELVIAECREKGIRLVNATDGGEGKKGCLNTEETRAKIGAWNRGRVMPPKSAETLRRMADAQRGKKHTLEHRARISSSLMGKPPTRGNTGKKASEETLAKLRGRVVSLETKEKIRASRVGKRHSYEVREKIRAAQLASQARRRYSQLHTMRIESLN